MTEEETLASKTVEELRYAIRSMEMDIGYPGDVDPVEAERRLAELQISIQAYGKELRSRFAT